MPPRVYQPDNVKYSNGNPFQKPKDMVKHDELDSARREQYKLWITFFRRNPHRLIIDYFGIKLFPYQILMIWLLQRCNLAYIVAARGTAKSYIIAAFSLVLSVLYPGIQVIVAGKTMKQGSIILEKIEQFNKTYPNVQREIERITTSQNNYECILRNGSTIKCVPSSENARGK